jgi:hypothetical protein
MASPLSADEAARAEVNFVPYVAQQLTGSGRFRVSVDTPDRVQLFQRRGAVSRGPDPGLS